MAGYSRRYFGASHVTVTGDVEAGGDVVAEGQVVAVDGVALGAASGPQLVRTLVDPRVLGLAAPRGTIAINPDGRCFRKYKTTGDTAWIALDDQGSGLWPAALDAESAADATAVLAGIVNGATAAPDRMVTWDSGLGTELLVGDTLTSSGAGATLVTTSFKNGEIDKAGHTLLGDPHYWAAADASKWKGIAGAAFAFVVIQRFTAVGSGGYAMSDYDQDGQAKGWSLGLAADGKIQMNVFGAGGNASTVGVANHADSTWRTLIFGRSITGNIIFCTSSLEDKTAASGAVGSIASTDGFFGLLQDLFGTKDSGATQDVSLIWRFTGADAEQIATNRVVIAANLHA